MARRRNSAGRNYRKRIVRKMRGSQHLALYSDSGCPKEKVNPVTNPPTSGQILAQLRQRFLTLHELRLRQCASSLGAPGCWEYYHLHLCHARKMKYEDDFRLLVVEAASRFLGRSVRTGHSATS